MNTTKCDACAEKAEVIAIQQKDESATADEETIPRLG